MASDMAPAAVPSPNDPPATATGGGPRKGLLASMVAPVDPARSADFDLAPAVAGGGGEQPVTGASSADYHADENSQVTVSKTTSANSSQERRVFRAWLLAGAERWRKARDVQLKRLDVQKARAQATQIKESRTVNRAEKIFGGNTGGGSSNGSGGSGGGGKGGSGKSLDSKTPKNGSHGSGGHSGPGGKGHSGGSGSGGGAGRGSSGGANHSSGGKGGADGGRSNSKGPSGGKDSGSGKPSSGKDSGGSNRSGSSGSGADGKSAGSGKGASGSSGSSGASGKAGAQGPSGKPGADGKSQDRKDPAADTDKASAGDKPNLTKTPAPDQAKPAGQDQKTPHGKADPNTPAKQQDDKTKPTSRPDTAKDAAGKPLTFRESRETGYRDGTRLAKGVSHVRAYSHGVKDGYTDITEAADREKTLLDKAHEQRKQDRQQPKPPVEAPKQGRPEPEKPSEKPKPADQGPKQDTKQAAPEPKQPHRAEDRETPPIPPHPPRPPQPPKKPDQPPRQARKEPPVTSQTDTTNRPTEPIPVRHVNDTHVYLGDGASRYALSHGEVRTLKQFERRLSQRCDDMQRNAESAQLLQKGAEAQAQRVTQLLEAARTVEGGERVTAFLARLAEAAGAQAAKAEEMHKRALRAAEACRAVLVNVSTRYGDIYKAVADSTENKPAKMRFYRDGN